MSIFLWIDFNFKSESPFEILLAGGLPRFSLIGAEELTSMFELGFVLKIDLWGSCSGSVEWNVNGLVSLSSLIIELFRNELNNLENNF